MAGTNREEREMPAGLRAPERLGPYLLHRQAGVFPLTEDTLLLGDFATLRRGDRVCDLGCGGGALLLLLRRREEGLALTGVEPDCAAADLAERNLAENGLEGRILRCGVGALGERLGRGSHDLVVSNPPYFAPGTGKWGGSARMEGEDGLEDFCAAAARLLRSGGRFALVHRTERLTDLMCLLRACRLEPKRMKLSGRRVWLESVKNARPGGLRLEET